ncbi:MAG: peptidase [Rhodopirellula sp. JB055]|uniref:peptidase n=1 Tax=Rhodopirellula sp. JB055 TaxID=3342846 RepID=UPI00370A455E
MLQPDPASGMVAEGDLVGVMVEVDRLGRSDVWLEIRDEHGQERQRMVRRSDENPGVLQHETEFSAASRLPAYSSNLPVQQTPIEYRILAGDAETLWHKLTPQPRPRAISFVKEYQFPAHTKLPNKITTEDHGDLTAFVGTKVTMKVEFDQPVRDAEMQFSSRGSGLALSPVSANEHQFEITIPISTPGSYRVDAIGVGTGLNNPFSPRYTIDPVVDRNPIAMWDDSIPRRQIVSPAAVLSLPGHLEDDIPLDYAIQQILLEGEGLTETKIQLNDPQTIVQLDLNWDLARFDGREKADANLPSGSRLKTRLIAVDRAGHRGQSNWIDIFIAQSGFDPDRHQDLMTQQKLTRQIVAWLEELDQINESMHSSMKAAIESPDTQPFQLEPEFSNQFEKLRDQWESISGFNAVDEDISLTPDEASPTTIHKRISSLNDPIRIDQWTRLDSAASFALAQAFLQYQTWQQISEQFPNEDSAPQRKRASSSHIGKLRMLRQLSSRSIDFIQALLAVELANGLSTDMETIQNSAEMLGDANANIPITRLPGQSELLQQQLQQLSDLLKVMEADLPEDVQRHHEQIHRFVDQRTQIISDAREKLRTSQDGNAEHPFRDTMGQIATEIEALRVHSLLHGNVANRIASAMKEFSAEPMGWGGQLSTLNRTGKQWRDQQRKTESLAERGDSNQLAESKSIERLHQESFQATRDTILKHLQRAERVEETRSDSQVIATSDLDLISRTLEAITTEGFTSPENMDLDAVAFFDQVAKAVMTLNAGNQLHRFEKQLQFVADRERYPVNSADAIIHQPIRLEHIQVANDIPMAQVRHLGLDSKVADPLRDTRWNADASQARDRLNRRRWANEAPVSAAIPIESMLQTYQSTWNDLDPMMEAAREFLRGLTPSLSDQAREAAKKAKQQSADIEEDHSKRSDSPEQVAAEAETKFDDLKNQLSSIAEQLADRANNADYSQSAEAQAARDADRAISAIEQQTAQVANQLHENQPDEASQSLDELSKTLDTIADHFEALDEGEEAAETRDALQELATDSETSPSMDNQFNAAESVAKANQMTPEQLLEQLEKKLPTDQPMQESLQDITEQTVRAAEQMIREAATEETSLRRNLERSDAEFAEQKRVARDELRSITDRAKAVQNHLLSMADQASKWANEDSLQREIQQIREQLSGATETAKAVQDDNALLEDLQDANQSLREVVQNASERTAAINEKAQQLQKQSLHNNEQSRAKAARQLESMQRRGKNQYLQSLQKENQQWHRNVDEAGRRIQQAQNQERNARRSLDQAKQQLKKHPGEDWAEKNVAEKQAQVDNAKTAAAAAKQTRDSARDSERLAKQHYEAARNRVVANLDAPNPAAEMLSRVTEQAVEELQELATSLASNQEALAIDSSLTPPASSNQPLAEQQQRLQSSVAMAAEELRRAARHEERLGNQASADKLDEVAEEIQAVNQQPMSEAQESLQSGRASQANDQLAQAAAQLQAKADALAQQTANDSTDQQAGANTGSENDPSSSQGQKLAKTLDELDRALHSPPPEPTGDDPSSDPSQQSSENQDSDQSGDGSASESPSDASGSQQGTPSNSAQDSGQQQTSGQASSTLAEAAQQAIRNLAQQRQRQLQQIAQAGEPSQPSDQNSSQPSSAQANNPALGEGQTHDNSLIDASDWNIVDGDWGELRERQTDEVIQDRKVRIPMTYRRAVQAYFEAVSAEAAKSINSQSGADR